MDQNNQSEMSAKTSGKKTGGNIIGTILLLIIVAAVVVWFSGIFKKDEVSDRQMMSDEEMDSMMGEDMNTAMDEMMVEDEIDKAVSDNMMQNSIDAALGAYTPFTPAKIALAEAGNVVLFFRASWCPTCRALDVDIKDHSADIPKDLAILDVDYDNSTALKQKYGVTYQHTLVQVDARGNQIAKWSGSPTLADLVAEVK